MAEVSSFYDKDSTIKTEFYGRILQDIIKRDGFSANIIENYNNEMINRIPDIIKNTKFEARNGIISFENVRPQKPRDNVKGEVENLYPMNSRMKTQPYFGQIIADVIFTPKPIGKNPSGEEIYNAIPEKKSNFVLGELPVMLGSELCHLHGLTDEQRMNLGECFTDPFGYFIIKSERVILTQTKLRVSAFLIYNDIKSQTLMGKITCPTEKGTMVFGIQIYNKYKSLRVLLQQLIKKSNKEGLPLFLIFKVLGVEPEDALEMIKKFIPKKDHEKIEYAAQSSLVEFYSINASTQEEYVEYIKNFRKSLEDRPINTENIIPDIVNQLFCDVKGVPEKLTHLAMYSARMFEILIETRKIDDRDSWGNNQLETAGHLIKKLFKEIWACIKHRIEPKIRLNDGIKAFINEYSLSEIKDNFVSAFGPNAWGAKCAIKQGKEGQNITESLKRDTPIAVFSQITKVNAQAARQAKNEELRMVHPSCLGYMGLFETPEGEGCGLIKNLASTCYISLERDPALYIAMVKPGGPLHKFISNDKKDDTQVPFLINGKIQGWCYSEQFISELKAMRKRGSEIQKDVCIFYNRNNRCVELYCDGGRPTRPLFVVDPEDQQLVVLKKRLENADIPTLIREGCIEYIDAREQEYIMLAQKVEQVLERNFKILEAEKLPDQLDKLNTYLPYFDTLITNLTQSYPDDKKLTNIKEAFDKIYDQETANDQEEILSIQATLLNEWFKKNEDKKSNDFTEDIYESIMKESKDYRLNELLTEDNFTHCEIDPCAIFTISENLIPMANRQNGPRTQFESGMLKQALGQYHSKEAERFDSSYKMLYYPTKTLFQPDLTEACKLNSMPNGQTLTVAIYSLPDNQEDGIIFKEEAIKYGNKFDMCKKMTTVSIAKNTTETQEFFEKPVVQPGVKEGIYAAIDENGLPRLDAYIRQGDCIIGKVRKYTNTKDPAKIGVIDEICEYAGVGEEGYVDRVLTSMNSSSEKVVKVKIRKNRKYIPGDKAAMRYSQKGTVSKVVPARYLPRISSGPNKGLVPDVFINSHGQPSRMTLNLIIEVKASKAAVIAGKMFNATTFRNFEDDMKFIDKTLTDYGLDPGCKEDFELPNGTPIQNKIFFGPIYYQALRHHVSDKIQMRARQGVKPSTRQPVSGRSKEGGLRVGEMERDALISHGSSALLRERLMDVSDAYTLPICIPCGTIAITDHTIKSYTCRLCGPKAKFGTVRIPYVVKLLLYFLNACGIHMTFNTENSVVEDGRPEEKFLL